MRRLIAVLALVSALSPMPLAGHADPAFRTDGARPWDLVVSPFALHWSSKDERKHVVLLGAERHEPDGWLAGASVFRNSFGQPSAYVYSGYQWDGLFHESALFFKLSAGVLYGYKGRYKDKVPFNHHGFGLAAIPAVGYRLTPQDAVQIGFLGTAAVIFTYNRRF